MVNFTPHVATNTRTAHSQNGHYKSIQAWKTKRADTATSNTAAPPQQQAKPLGTAQKQVIANLEKAAIGRVGTFDMELKTSLSYADATRDIAHDSPNTAKNNTEKEESFQFGDVIDIINPLHHLPVVNLIYHGLTNDKLHPMSQIIGGALYGGPVGAVTGTINAISQVQTGKDIGGHVLSLAGFDSGTSITNNINKDDPEAQLNKAAKDLEEKTAFEKLPGSTMAFVNLSEPNRAYKNIEVAQGRTAGKMIVRNHMASYQQNIKINPILKNTQEMETPPKADLENLPSREKITSISLSAMPARQET